MPLTDISEQVQKFHELLDQVGDKLDEETTARLKSIHILYGVIAGLVALALLVGLGFRLQHDSQVRANHRAAVATCLATNHNREALRTVIAREAGSTEAALSVSTATLQDVSQILALAASPTSTETPAQRKMAAAFLASADAQINGTIAIANAASADARQGTSDLVSHFPNLKCG